MKTQLTADQTARATGIHSRASDMMNAEGFTLLRQFQAKGAKDSESFEVWCRNGRTVVLHFYAEAGGVELYLQQQGNSWGSMAAALRAL